MSTLDELGEFLEDAAVAEQGVDLFLSSMPDGPDEVLVLYEYPGGMPEYVQESYAPNAENPQIQVVARSLSYESARTLCQNAWNALAAVTNAYLGGTKYRSIRPNSSPALLRRDTNDRVLVYFNASVSKEVSVGAVS